MPFQFEALFPTTILRGSLPQANTLNKKLLTDIKILSTRDVFGKKWSEENYPGGYTSYASLSDLHHRSPLFLEFSALLQPHAVAFAKAQGWATKGMRLEMNSLWMNVMPRGTYHTLHLHPHSVISGTYYVSTPKGSVSLKLEDPRMNYYMAAPLRVRGPQMYHHIAPKAGQFVMFESWLRHEVPPNQSKDPRVSLSFNYSLVPKED